MAPISNPSLYQLIAYATLGCIVLIVLPLCVLCIYKLYKNYNETYFIRRHSILVALSTLAFSSFLLLESPFYEILIIKYGSLELVPHSYIVYASAFFKSFYYAIAIIYSLRVWLLYYEHKYHQQLSQHQWELFLNPSQITDYWFIYNRSTVGRPRVLYKGALILWLIVSLIHLNILLLTQNTSRFYISYWSYLLFILALCVIFIAIIWRKLPRNDEFEIKTELKFFITCFIIITVAAIAIMAVIISVQFDIVSMDLNVSFAMFIITIILHSLGIYSTTLGVVRSMKNKQNADEYAKQLTLLDWELFIVINPRICLYKILAKQRTDEWLALKLFIDRFQQTHRYVIVSIVGSAPDLRARIEMIEFFILVADHLLSINNLYSFMAVMTALDSVSIQKLRIAWDLVDKGLKEKYMNRLSPLCSANNNYKALRDYTLRMEAPAIPFLALLLKDLTFTNDGHKDRLSADLDGHINFNKYMLLFRILSDNIDRFQSKTYCQRMMHSKQFESEDINGLVQQLAVYEIEEEDKDEDKREVNYIDIIPDMELQQNILEDLNVYIVLGRDVIRQMTTEANRTDSLKRGQYILEYTDRKMNENEDKIKNQKQSTISNVIRMLFTSYQSTNALNTLAE
eukprot:447747_1